MSKVPVRPDAKPKGTKQKSGKPSTSQSESVQSIVVQSDVMQPNNQTRAAIQFVFRDRVVSLDNFSPRRTLLDWLREDQHATGTKEGCGEGDCGACTVVLARLGNDGQIVWQPVNACIMLLGQVDGAAVLTVEDLAKNGVLHPVQQAMVRQHGSQCGFCTPGIVMSLYALYQGGTRPVTRDMINDQLSGNLCRCTGYRPIVDAALEACADAAPDRGGEHLAKLHDQLHKLADNQHTIVGGRDQFFAAPASETELTRLYSLHPDATLLAGATDVGLWLTKGLQDLKKIIWLGRVQGLDEITQEGDVLSISAMASHAKALPWLAAIDPDLGEIMRRFGSKQVRSSGTVGGNVANGSPIGDLPPALIALGAKVELASDKAIRTIALEDFFLAYRSQDRKKGEYVRRLLVPKPGPNDHFRALKVTKRFDEDISCVMGAFRLTVKKGKVENARIAFGGMAGVPARAKRAESALVGAALGEPESWNLALDALGDDFTPLSDQRASAAYRRLVARNLLEKVLIELAAGERGEIIATRILARQEASHGGH